MRSPEQPLRTNDKKGEVKDNRVTHLIKLAKERGEAVFSGADDYMDTFPEEVG